MKAGSVVIVIVGLTLAGAVFLFAPRFLGTPSPDPGQSDIAVETAPPVELELAQILIAARDLPAGTKLADADLEWAAWPKSALRDNFTVSPDDGAQGVPFEGALVLAGMVKGEPVLKGKISEPGETRFLAAALAPGMRAVSVAIDAVRGAAGFIQPGDRVDVILTEAYDVAHAGQDVAGSGTRLETKRVASTVLQNVVVRAIDQKVEDLEGAPKLGTTATLEVSPKQAEKLALAGTMGRLSLALRARQISGRGEAWREPTQDLEVSRFLARAQEERKAAQNAHLIVYRGAEAGQ